MSKPDCYVASPLGFSESTVDYYRQVFLPRLSEVVEPIDPWSLTTQAEVDAAASDADWTALGKRIAARNVAAIRAATILVAHLDGQEVDSGTASEVGYAVALGHRCFGLRTDLRQAGEKGMTVNLQVEGFILQSGGRVERSLDGLIDALARAVTESD